MLTPSSRRQFLVRSTALLLAAESTGGGASADEGDDPVAAWRTGVSIRPLTPDDQRHSMHTYYLLNPESPDGRRVVFFTSTDKAGHVGEVRVLDRATGREAVLADEVHTEDAHRVALQQWTLGGRAVAYHEVVDGRWRVMLVDVETRERRVIAEDRQLGFGRGDGHILPIYGCHWNPGPHRGLQLHDLNSGELHEPLRIEGVERQYGEWLQQEFQGKPTSIAFPTVSPDHRRVFFKMAAGDGGDQYMGKVSQRQGLVCFDLAAERLLSMRTRWGHPAWHPDSRRIIEMGNILLDSDDGAVTRIPDVPVLRGQHLAVAPRGDLWVSDGLTESIGGPAGEWGVLVADLRGGRHQLVDRFEGRRGARSWRVSHPHPVFSADGKRLYYNVNAGEFTELRVAERGDS